MRMEEVEYTELTVEIEPSSHEAAKGAGEGTGRRYGRVVVCTPIPLLPSSSSSGVRT